MSPEKHFPYNLDSWNIWYHEDHGYFRFLEVDYDTSTGQTILWFQPTTINPLGTTPSPAPIFGYRVNHFRNIVFPMMRLAMGYTPEGINTIHPH